jgi:hypothetical protein
MQIYNLISHASDNIMLNRDIFNVIIVYISHLMMAQEGRNM